MTLQQIIPIGFLACVAACGSQTTAKAPLTFENPNFEDGLTGWETSGQVTVVDVDDLPGFGKAAVLTYDGTTPALLWQEIIIPRDMYIGVSAQEIVPEFGWLRIGFGVPEGGAGGGKAVWAPEGIEDSVDAGKVKVVWTVDGTPSQNFDPNTHTVTTTPVPAGSYGKVTGVVINPNAVQPGPT